MLCSGSKEFKAVVLRLFFDSLDTEAVWVLRQAAQAFPIALTFLACRYCYGQPRAWDNWRLSLETPMGPNG